MKKSILRIKFFLTVCICCIFQTNAQEKIFANYFDIETNSPEGTEVIGKIHLERNKDVMTNPIPEGYSFEILKQEDNMFKIETTFDPSKRIMGVLSVNKGKNTGKRPGKKHLTIALKNGEKTINEFDIKINITKETLWSVFNRRYTPIATKNPRMYGRKKFTDKETAFYIQELKDNNWKFKGFRCYDSHPDEYKAYFDPKNDHAPSNTIEYDWVKVTELIGGLGYAYINSKVYGPEGSPAKRKELREALYNSIYTYMQSVPVEGSDLKIDGKDIGNCTGDGFILLQEHKMAGMQITTHQWTMTDALIAPILHLMPDLIKKMDKGDKFSLDFHNAMIRYFQVFFAEIKGRRPIDDPNGRWGELQDTIYSAGAWADANLGHRSRTMLALPIIWHDYNRPLTYVQYWYTDFYNDKPFKGFSYSTGWSPCGIVKDISYWMTKFNVVAHKYMQSGFQPDGTVSHHIGHGTDAAMVAYGFEWLTGCNTGYAYLRDTKFKIGSNNYQFQLDRLLNVYPNLFYKGHMDFLVSGRTFLTDLKSFVSGTYLKAVKSLEKSRSKDTELNGIEELKAMASQLKNNTFETTATKAFWVNEFLVHRKAESGKTFYSSVKLKSERTVGIEDFSKPRKSWHGGYGILQVKVKGDEYDKNVLSNMDWHALPGLTEEWRTDPFPVDGGAQASLPGANKVSGVMSDGERGMAIYHHLPQEKYSSASGLKTYHFIDDKILSAGSCIKRINPGQNKEIVTFIDQTELYDKITYCIGGKPQTVDRNMSVNITEDITEICWIHHGEKGYLVIPQNRQQLMIRTGKEINITDRKISNKKPNFIIALNHGVNPSETYDNSYIYYQIPNVKLSDMPEKVDELINGMECKHFEGTGHSVYSSQDKTWQYAFFKPGTISANNKEVTSVDAAMLMLKDNGDKWILTVSNPAPDGKKETLEFITSFPLKEGRYDYSVGGVYPMKGEYVNIVKSGKGSKIIVQLPDIRDEKKYNYQSELYAATSITVNISK